MSRTTQVDDLREAGSSTDRSRAQQNQNWLFAVEWSVLAVLAIALFVFGVLPGWRNLRSEFPDYYLAAELYHRDIPLDRVYEWTWFQRQNDRFRVREGLVSFAPNPPTSVLPLIPLTTLTPLDAKRVWILVSLMSLALSLWILRHTTSLEWRRVILIALLCFLPLRLDIAFGRYYVLILFLICASYYFARRRREGLSGFLWSVAAALKLFPALSILLFARKQNWRALAGFFLGAMAITAVSIAMFGAEVHRVFLHEVLSQASRGDWLGPYSLSQNSFTTLWSHLFLIEPELNPAPLLNSPTAYAVAMAVTTTVLALGFISSISRDVSPHRLALHWAALIPLLLLLSTTTAPDHSCLLIFTAIVGIDALLAMGRDKQAALLLILYVVACAPAPDRIANWLPPYRLVAIASLFACLLYNMRDRWELPAKAWMIAGLICVCGLTLYNLHQLRSREEDFSRRLPIHSGGYRFANPVAVSDRVAITVMQPAKYEVTLLTSAGVCNVAMPGDALSIAGSAQSAVLYSEQTAASSFITQLPVDPPSAPQILVQGQEPSLSPNGKWLAFVREERGERTVWVLATNTKTTPQQILASSYRALDVTATDDGDVIAAAGKVSDPHLLLVKRETHEVSELPAFPHPARYPAISPDGKRLAFSRREGGSWHLLVRSLAGGTEQQLTHASCNAISPAWADDRMLLYATDCGRGVRLSAIARVVLPN